MRYHGKRWGLPHVLYFVVEAQKKIKKSNPKETIDPADAPIASLLHVCVVLEKSKMQMHVIAVAPSQSIVAFAS